MLMALLVAIPLVGIAAAQSPPPGDNIIIMVNAVREFVERKKEGGFIVRLGGIHASLNEALDTASDVATITGHTWVPARKEA